jgi:VanZ family protein
VFIEAVQMHLPARSAEWLDVAADSAGIALGLLAAATARHLWPAPLPSF